MPVTGIFFGLRNFLSRVFYSLQDTRTPMRVGIVSVCINIGLNLTLSRVIGAMGLTLATTTAALAGATLQLILLHKKMGNMGLGSVIGQLFKILLSLAIATAGMIVVLTVPGATGTERITFGIERSL
ncbi:MAG: lipid II flippase MurJ [Christensenellales bacterium]